VLHPGRARAVLQHRPCRKTAFRRRHQQPGPAVTVPAALPRREITVYERPDCGDRYPRRATLRELRHLRPPGRHRRRLPELWRAGGTISTC